MDEVIPQGHDEGRGANAELEHLRAAYLQATKSLQERDAQLQESRAQAGLLKENLASLRGAIKRATARYTPATTLLMDRKGGTGDEELAGLCGMGVLYMGAFLLRAELVRLQHWMERLGGEATREIGGDLAGLTVLWTNALSLARSARGLVEHLEGPARMTGVAEVAGLLGPLADSLLDVAEWANRSLCSLVDDARRLETADCSRDGKRISEELAQHQKEFSLKAERDCLAIGGELRRVSVSLTGPIGLLEQVLAAATDAYLASETAWARCMR